MTLVFDLYDQDYQKAHEGAMMYQCIKYGPCGYCSSVARGDRRKHLEEEQEKEEETIKTISLPRFTQA